MSKPKRYYVTRLLFNRFAYQINLEFVFPKEDRRKNSVTDFRLTPHRRWLSETLAKNSYRTRISWSRRKDQTKQFVDVCEFNLYIQTEDDYRAVLEKYGEHAVTVKHPENAEVADLIAQGAEIEYRPHWYYHLYQYKVYLSVRQIDFRRLKSMVEETFASDDPQAKRYKFTSGNIIYMNHEDLVLCKLSFGERIKRVTAVRITDFADDAIPDEQRLYVTNLY